jgi:hypothetical protein
MNMEDFYKKLESKILNVIISLLIIVIIVLIIAHDTVKIGESDVLAFIGSIIGGIITLAGVYYTIRSSFVALELTLKKQDDLKFLETIGEKLNRLYKVKGIIFKVDRMLSNRKNGWNEKYEKDNLENIENAILEYLLPNLNPLLENASVVDWEFYNDIKKFVDDTRSYIFNLDSRDFDRLTESVDRLTKIIENHEKRLSEKFKKVSSQK